MDPTTMIFNTVGGLGLFLVGMGMLSEGLKRAAGERLRQLLETITRRPAIALLTGAGVTCLIQSSSATTVIVVGLVNAGLLTLRQAICVILGANVGTTFTAWLVGLAAGVQHLKISTYALPAVGLGLIFQVLGGRKWLRGVGLALLGVGAGLGVLAAALAGAGHVLGRPSPGMELAGSVLAVMGAAAAGISGMFLAAWALRRAARHTGQILIGFGVLFLGILFMKEGFEPLKDSPATHRLLVSVGDRPILAVLVGMGFTMLVQSSSASIMMIQVLAATGAFGDNWHEVLRVTIPFILGDNIGTTITAQIAALQTSLSGRRAAMAHTLFNVFGVALMLPLVYMGWFVHAVIAVAPWTLSAGSIALHLAVAHSTFNVVCALAFLPLVGALEKIVMKVVPTRRDEAYLQPVTLERHLLGTPTLAMNQARREIVRMAAAAKDTLADAVEAVCRDDRERLAQVARKEEVVDAFQTEITRYLVELSQRPLSQEQANELPVLLHTVNDLERISDHAVNIAEVAARKLDQGHAFTPAAADEMRSMRREVDQMFDEILAAVRTFDAAAAEKALVHEAEVNRMQVDFRRSHTQRVAEGACEAMAGLLFIDFVDNMEKVGDHLTNIAQGVVGGLQWDGKPPPAAPLAPAGQAT